MQVGEKKSFKKGHSCSENDFPPHIFMFVSEDGSFM